MQPQRIYFPIDPDPVEPIDQVTGEVYSHRDVMVARMLRIPVEQLVRERDEDWARGVIW